MFNPLHVKAFSREKKKKILQKLLLILYLFTLLFIDTFLIKLNFYSSTTWTNCEGRIYLRKLKLSKVGQTFNLKNWAVSQTFLWVGKIYSFEKVYSR